MNALDEAKYYRDTRGRLSMVMPLMRLPQQQQISTHILTLMKRIACNFAEAPTNAGKRVRHWLEQKPLESRLIAPFEGHELEHYLSAQLVTYRLTRSVTGRSLKEWDALQSLGVPPFGAAQFAEFNGFLEQVFKIYEAVTGWPAKFRTTLVGTRYDRRGIRVLYPGFRSVLTQMQRIHRFQQQYARYPGFVAVVTLVALLNVHPFRDGNGRLARAVFNWILNTQMDAMVYLPIHELADLSNAGYLIRVRQAAYFGDWLALATFLDLTSRRLFFGE